MSSRSASCSVMAGHNLSGISKRAFDEVFRGLRSTGWNKQELESVRADWIFSSTVKKEAAKYERSLDYGVVSAAGFAAITEVLSYAVQLVRVLDAAGNAPPMRKARRFIYRGTPYFFIRLNVSGGIAVSRNAAAFPFAFSGLGGTLDYQGGAPCQSKTRKQ